VRTDMGRRRLSALAVRSPVAADVEERPPASVGAGACFVVGEALANIAKHSKATSADVTVRRNGERLIVKEGDDVW
jgi:signal transduction histidine kinase